MKTISTIAISIISIGCNAQSIEENPQDKSTPMSATSIKYTPDRTQLYYEKGADKPFTGTLYANYDNGQLMSKQDFVDGQGNGSWTNYDPDGRKIETGTYVNNRVEGPVTQFYEDGSIKAKGQYRYWKMPIGKWVYYDRQGNIVHTQLYTP